MPGPVDVVLWQRSGDCCGQAADEGRQCGNHDPHRAAAVAERMCPDGHGDLVPYEHSHCGGRAAELWLWCGKCRQGFIPRPRGLVGQTSCSPNGFCTWGDYIAY